MLSALGVILCILGMATGDDVFICAGAMSVMLYILSDN